VDVYSFYYIFTSIYKTKCGEDLLVQWGVHNDLSGYAFRIVRDGCKKMGRYEFLAIMVARLTYDLKLGALCLNTIWNSLDKWGKGYLDRCAARYKA
jgi:hypothetical protein